ncbi:hypothetical protein L208DRAFT_485725 [Tricholoma matsutake]|nr:hypothetical protein L208DRAFT_485725 [Tricholoma matsutake 945]
MRTGVNWGRVHGKRGVISYFGHQMVGLRTEHMGQCKLLQMMPKWHIYGGSGASWVAGTGLAVNGGCLGDCKGTRGVPCVFFLFFMFVLYFSSPHFLLFFIFYDFSGFYY